MNRKTESLKKLENRYEIANKYKFDISICGIYLTQDVKQWLDEHKEYTLRAGVLRHE